MLTLCLVFLPFGFGIADWLIGTRSEKGRDLFAVFSTFIELVLSLLLLAAVIRGSAGIAAGPDIPYVFGEGLCFRTGGFRAVYSVVTALMWAFTTLFSLEYFRHEPEHLGRYYFFVLVTLGATEGVMLSGSLMTTFLFFEILSLTSFIWVMHEETPGALRAGYTYLFIAVIGGLVLFMGMVLLQHAAGTLVYEQLPEAVRSALGNGDPGTGGMLLSAGICILIGFGCKAGMFPVHVWLPKAHPVAPSPASALLSGVLTKVGIYGILMTSAEALADNAVYGWTVLILGTVTMLLGAVLALFSVNLKRTLACSSMSQIGFILTGIAMAVLLTAQGAGETAGEGAGAAAGLTGLHGHAAVSLAGAMLHMVNHSMLKLCLFCAAGAVVMNIHALDLNRIRGWGRRKPLIRAAFFLGLLGISGVPLFNGYASKTLLHEAITAGIAEAGEGAAITMQGASVLHGIEWIFLISGGCTFAYMLKLFICVFVEKNRDRRTQDEYDRGASGYMNPASAAVIFGTALLFPVLGQKPVFNALASLMTGHAGVLDEFRPLSWECVSGGLISLGIGTFLYLVLIRRGLMKDGAYIDRWPAQLDLEDLFYRPLLTVWLPAVFGTVLSVFGENKVLRRVCPAVLRGASGAVRIPGENKVLTVAGRKTIQVLGRAVPVAGENRVLRPAAGWIFTVLAVACKLMAMGTDVFIVLLRKTLLRERVVSGTSGMRLGRLHRKNEQIREAYSPLLENFSFALMLSCIGMLVIFAVILFYILVG